VHVNVLLVEGRRLDAKCDRARADKEAAAEIDSCITSRRLPVAVIFLPLPGIIAASMVSACSVVRPSAIAW
jgi:hypothetical protein